MTCGRRPQDPAQSLLGPERSGPQGSIANTPPDSPPESDVYGYRAWAGRIVERRYASRQPVLI